MPPRGVKKGTKRARQYEHIKKSEKEAGRSEGRAEEIAARAVNKEKARSGESRSSSRSSTRGRSASSRGGKRSGSGPGGRTREQLYNDAKKLGIEGRSKMSKPQLQRAVAGPKADGWPLAERSVLRPAAQYHLPRAKPPKAIKPISATMRPIQKLQTNIRTTPTMTRIPPSEIPTMLSSLSSCFVRVAQPCSRFASISLPCSAPLRLVS